MTSETGSLPPRSVAALLVAAGRGTRFGARANKVLESLAGMPVWWHSARKLRDLPCIGPLVIVTAASDASYWSKGSTLDLLQQVDASITLGGEERTDSVLAGIQALPPDLPADCLIAIHDAARPCVLPDDLQHVIASAAQTGAAILARPLNGTIKRARPRIHEPNTAPAANAANLLIHSTVDRRDLWEALTPQVMRRDWLLEAYERWRGRPVTDDADLLQLAGRAVSLIAGDPTNLKITNPRDLDLAAAILASQRLQA